MADGMCGPSNALQNFQKHSTVDRTLQQDRLISRSSPSQGFRSSPGPNAGLLDPEFEAFQAGQLPLDRTFQPQDFSHAPPQAGPSGWASGFQRLNISNSRPQIQQQTSNSQMQDRQNAEGWHRDFAFQQQPFNPQAQNRQDTGGWHQDFAQQQNQIAGEGIAQVSQNLSSRLYRNDYPVFAGGVVGPQAGSSMAQQSQPVEAFDEEAFARAFEEAAKLEMEVDARQELNQQGVELGQDILISESAERLMAITEGPLNQERIGADTIHDPLSEPADDEPNHNDSDALAITAGKLLDSVRHDQSSKFRNSQFLELMRQFRDREATVEGDEVVSTQEQGFTPPKGEELKVGAP
jgi:hypothetical protein